MILTPPLSLKRATSWFIGISALLSLQLDMGAKAQGFSLLQIAPAAAEETVEPHATGSALPRPAHEPASKLKATLKAPAKAGQAPAAVAAPATPDAEGALAAGLREKDEAAIEAVKKLGAMDTPRALDVLLTEVAIGVSPKVADAALDVLAAKKAPESIAVLGLYAQHRNPELRRKALLALAALPEPGTAAAKPAPAAKDKPAAAASFVPNKAVTPLLLTALSDQSAEVRAVAAEALGARREKSAEPKLIKLLQRKDPSAPVALGLIGGADTARALGEMIGNVPDRLITETLGELLRRPDFGPDPVRLEVVKTLGKMPGAQTLDILTDYVKATAKESKEALARKDKERPSRIEANKIIEQRTAK